MVRFLPVPLMSMWTADLTKYGSTIRQWWGVVKSFINGRGAATFPAGESMVHVSVESFGEPEAHDDSVAVDLRVRVVVRNETLAQLVHCQPVNVGRWAALKFPKFRWPEITSHTGCIVARWPEGFRPAVNVVGPDPQIASVTINDDGTGTIELTGGPDGAIKY